MKTITFLLIILLSTFSIANDQRKNREENLKINFSQIEDSTTSLVSTISYSQEEKEKKFIAKFALPLGSTFFLNGNIVTSEISDGVGPVGIANILGDEKSSMAKGAQLSLGITWKAFKIWTLSILMGTNFTTIDYLSPDLKFEKISDSQWGYSARFGVGYSCNSTSLIGLSIEYAQKYKIPQERSIIRELLWNELPNTPTVWESTKVYLEPLKKVDLVTIQMEYRMVFLKSFSFNPFIKVIVENRETVKPSIAINLLASLDSERKWSVGIQPKLYWLKNDQEKMSPNLGIALFLTTAFKMN